MTRRTLPAAVAAITLSSAATLSSVAGAAGTPSAKEALAIRPTQRGVELARLDAGDCEVRDYRSDGASGWEVTDGDGIVVRRFVDTDGDKRIDRWCYFRDGVEVYRDIDENGNNRPDAYRWMGTAGTRWGVDEDEDSRIDAWKQISPEEVSAEAVAALAAGDSERFERLLITPEELDDLGLGPDATRRVAAKASRAAADFAALSRRQKDVSQNAVWLQLAATRPGVVPAGTDGSTRDVTAYENAVAMYRDGDRNGQLMVGTIVRVGDAWRLVDLPSVGDDGAVAATGGNFFAPAVAGGRAIAGGMSEETQQLVTRLESIDETLNRETDPARSGDAQKQRADVLQSLIERSADAGERETWVRQLVDTVSMAVQTGAYPEGIERLRDVAPEYRERNPALAAYADWATINAEYVLKTASDDDIAKGQDWYQDALRGFTERYAGTPEAAKAYLQLALGEEFNGNAKDAIDYYETVAAEAPDTIEGRKAAGAIRRLDGVGKPLTLDGETVDGKRFSMRQLRGKPVVVHYWATWCEPCKADMKALRRLQAAYARQGLQLVGVNVDSTREQAAEFLKRNPLPWPQLHAPGGLDESPLATSLGVQTVPLILVADAKGRMVDNEAQAATLDKTLKDMLRRR